MEMLHVITRRKTRPTNTMTDLNIFIEKTPYNVICFRDGQKVISQTKPMYVHMHTNASNLKPAKCTRYRFDQTTLLCSAISKAQ